MSTTATELLGSSQEAEGAPAPEAAARPENNHRPAPVAVERAPKPDESRPADSINIPFVRVEANR